MSTLLSWAAGLGLGLGLGLVCLFVCFVLSERV